MVELMISAPASGSGKTVLACALLAALKDRGLDPCAFKCGPDYIDPMFHRSALGVDSHNLDLFLAGEDGVRGLYRRYGGGRGSIVGTVLGTLIVAVMNNLLNLIGVDPYLSAAFKGAIIIGAVLLQRKEKA